jgi:hypothetical protein
MSASSTSLMQTSRVPVSFICYGFGDEESVGRSVDGSSVGVPDGDGSPETDGLDVSVGVEVVDFVGVRLGLGERVVRVGRGALVCEGDASGVGATLTGAGGGRTSR